MHYYSFNIGDYRRDTSHLSRLEHSIYRDLIDWYYLEESPIPLETQSVTRRLRLGTQEEAIALENVLSDFFAREDDGFHHYRIDADIAKYRHDCAKNKENGKKGGRPKAAPVKEENPLGYDSVTTGNPLVTQLEPNSKATNNQEPITNNQIKAKAKRAVAQPASPGFALPVWLPEEIWSSFVEMRKRIKAPLTAKAAELIIRDLCKLCDEGHNPVAVIEQSIARSWRGVFPVKGGSSAGGNGGADAVDFFKEEARKMRANGGSQ